MKIKFDTNTKDVGAATAAFSSLYPYCRELTLSVSHWNEDVINIYGEIDTNNIGVLQSAITDDTFNEDTDKL